MNKAFVLGVGLGTRLRPLTEQLPKPLVPFFHQPLICRAFDHVIAAGAEQIAVNTFHLPETYELAFPSSTYSGVLLHFRQEVPTRLETAGGIANVRDLLEGPEPFLVYNGDILTDLPLQPLIDAHRAAGNLVTLVLRSHGPHLRVHLDRSTGRVRDIHNLLGTGLVDEFQFTGIYLCDPSFLDWLTPGKVESVIQPFLEIIRRGAGLGGVVIDEGHWWDLGDRDSYLDAHLAAAREGFGPCLHAAAEVAPEAVLRGINVIGPGALVEAGAELEDCILWPGARATATARLRRCIIRSACVADGAAEETDF